MRTVVTGLVALWGCVYTGSLAWAVWKQGNYRGGIFTALLAIAVLITPIVVQFILAAQ